MGYQGYLPFTWENGKCRLKKSNGLCCFWKYGLWFEEMHFYTFSLLSWFEYTVVVSRNLTASNNLLYTSLACIFLVLNFYIIIMIFFFSEEAMKSSKDQNIFMKSPTEVENTVYNKSKRKVFYSLICLQQWQHSVRWTGRTTKCCLLSKWNMCICMHFVIQQTKIPLHLKFI